MKKDTAGALAEAVTALAVVAWVGGITALGAFAARIVFRDLPRSMAAPTMNSIFRSFDGAIVVALAVLAIAAVVRLWARGLGTRADRIALGAAIALLVLGVSDVALIHPRIEEMFNAGRTLEPAFLALHKLSSRAANLEILVAALLLGAHAFGRLRANND
jgi:hypothetical protein